MAILAGASRVFGLANRTNINILLTYVIFTTITKNGPSSSTTPTGVRRDEVKKSRNCCIFYNIWHDSLDFTMYMV